MKIYTVDIEFTESLLGTVPKDPDIYKNFIASKVENKDVTDEIETVEDLEVRGWTGFHKLDGNPILYDYVIKGFFKDACGMLRRDSTTSSSKLTSYKKVIDGLLFAYPRRIPIVVNYEGELGDAHYLGGDYFYQDGNNQPDLPVLDRPLRAETAKGPRVALTRSDICPIGSKIQFKVEIIAGISKKLLTEWLEYGARRGIGQWRNASYGRFTFRLKTAYQSKAKAE